MVLSHGKPVSFLVPYEDMLDLVETIDELKDQKLLGEIEFAAANDIVLDIPAHPLGNLNALGITLCSALLLRCGVHGSSP